MAKQILFYFHALGKERTNAGKCRKLFSGLKSLQRRSQQNSTPTITNDGVTKLYDIQLERSFELLWALGSSKIANTVQRPRGDGDDSYYLARSHDSGKPQHVAAN